MARIGLIAGGGMLPVEFVRSARKLGDDVVVFALKDMASPTLEQETEKLYWLEIGQYKKFAFLLLKERIRRVALLGKVKKDIIYDSSEADAEYSKALKGLRDKKDYSILEEVTRHLGKVGVEVVDNMGYLSHLLPEKGVLSRTAPDARVKEDILFGYDIAKDLAGKDIGQTVIIKDKTVVAVEAMEGTDTVIKRAGDTAGEGCVMVKVSRPDQDMRWDVPVVGPDTLQLLAEKKFAALAVESGKMYLIEKDEMMQIADAAGIAVEAL